MAAHLLEASTDDIVINPDEGTIGVIGVPASSLSWADLAKAANEQLPDGVLDNADGMQGLGAQLDFNQKTLRSRSEHTYLLLK